MVYLKRAEYRYQFSENLEDYFSEKEIVPQKESKKGLYVLIAVVFLIIIIGSFFIFGKTPKKEQTTPTTTTLLTKYCGNRICEEGENCYDCAPDCPCNENEYCNATLKMCVPKGICGDGTCSLYESKETCCIDCGCWYATQICNPSKNECEWIPMNLTNEDGIRLVSEYIQKEGVVIKNITVLGEYGDEEKVYKSVKVEIEGEEWPRYLMVDEEGNIKEYYPT